MHKKNDLVTVTITDIAYNGSAIGKTEDGFVVFVPGLLIGETAQVKLLKVLKNTAYAKVEKIVFASESRQNETCSLSAKCGGCCFHHTTYENELKIKQNLVKNAFRPIAHYDFQINPVIGSEKETCYRNKMLLPVGTDKNGNPVAGFYRPRSHDIIPCSDCLITPPEFLTIADEVLSHMKEYRISSYNEETKKGIIRHIFVRKGEHSGKIMVGLVVNLKIQPDKLKKSLFTDELAKRLISINQKIVSIGINLNTKHNNVILGEDTITVYGEEYITDTMNGISFRISLPSFYQVNTLQAEKMYHTALDLLDAENKTVFDLYSGIGTITLNLAKKSKKVYGIESCQPAVNDAIQNQKLNTIENAEFICGLSETEAPRLVSEGVVPDAVVLDPPRSGCDKALLDMLLDIKPEQIVYISCNPSTQARDLLPLLENGYQIKTVQPFDLFPRTFHVECCVLLCREKKENSNYKEMM